jgi:hypothetical protein
MKASSTRAPRTSQKRPAASSAAPPHSHAVRVRSRLDAASRTGSSSPSTALVGSRIIPCRTPFHPDGRFGALAGASEAGTTTSFVEKRQGSDGDGRRPAGRANPG